ncbi:porin [Vibrio sp. SNU_ST1]|uniref:porin n=1 Tax=Vibrio sp. SNU_ST1 TaxID=3064001 RepID=UPI002729988C|nr:porin [Vibrio sp. SNU_ST1]WKY59003.1 porin [Vibrio sp. SNU_ST1]
MKKTLLALVVAAASTSAFANVDTQNSKPNFEFDPMHKDQFSVSGAIGLGGYYDTKTKALYDDWATAVTVATIYQNNRLRGYVEVDLELNYSTDEAKKNIQSGPATDLDKAWLGYETDFGLVSFGWENDTALDKVDGAGDNTYEFGSSAGDTSDAFNVIKFEGKASAFAYGISTFETDDNREKAETGYNGYFGVEQETYKVYAGYETREAGKEDQEVISLSGNVTLGAASLGANFWVNDNETKAKTGSTDTGYYLSGSYAVTEALKLAAGYNAVETDFQLAGKADVDMSRVNIAAMYTLNDRVDMGIDILRDLDTKSADQGNETAVFAAMFYSF